MTSGKSGKWRAAIALTVAAALVSATVVLLAKPSGARTSTPPTQATATGVVEWMKNGPPRESSGVSLAPKDESIVVGIVLPKLDESDKGATVSGTVIAVETKGKTQTEATGEVVIETPDHKSHRVKSGDVITFAAAAGGAFALTSASGKRTEAPLSFSNKAGPKATSGPFIVQDNCALNLPLPSNGNAAETTCKIAGQPAKIVAAKPGDVITVPQGLAEAHGSVPIEGGAGGKTATLEGLAVHTNFRAPARLIVGQKAKATLTITDLQSFRNMKSGQPLTAIVSNQTPEIVTLGRSQIQSYDIDAKKIKSDGTTEILVDFTAQQPGKYTIGSRIADRTKQGCALSCTGCTGSGYFTHYAFCNDAGAVNCYGAKDQACSGVCVHRAGGPCGFWFCNCSFGKCHCK